MQRRPLGPGAPAVSVVGLGGMPLSIPGRPEMELDAMRVVHAALDAGMTLIDTADVYCLDDRDVGHNERLIARALRHWRGRRDEVVVATKGGLIRPGGGWESDARPEHLRAACEASLHKLGCERIDLYQLHRPDPQVPFAESVGALADLQREGKIRRVGLSNVTVEQIREAAGIVAVVSVQNRLSPFFREALETGVVAHCAAGGIGFLAYSPVGGGRLNLRLPEIGVVRSLARAHRCSPHAVALAWVLAQGPTVIVIPGARTTEHAADSARAGDLALAPEELAAVDGAEFPVT